MHRNVLNMREFLSYIKEFKVYWMNFEFIFKNQAYNYFNILFLEYRISSEIKNIKINRK